MLQQLRVQTLFGLCSFLCKLGAGVQVDRSQWTTGKQQGMFAVIAFPVMALPLVPHPLGVVIHALPAEEVGIEPGVSLFFVLQAFQHELHVCFGQ